MNGVQTISLGEIMAKKSGSVDPSKFPDEVFDLYSIPAFDSRQPEVVAGKLIGSTKQIVEPSDVLLSKIVPHIRRSWVVGEAQGRRIIASGEWIVFRSEKIYPNYLRHVLVSDPFHSKFMSTVSGVGGSLLRARPAFVEKIKIPLPPLEKQKRIADILDRAEALRAKRRAALAQLDELTQSIFYEMFGDPVTNSKEWKTKPLRELVNEFRYGTSNKSQMEGRVTLRIPNIIGGIIDYSDLKLVPVDTTEFERLKLIDGDVLFVRTNGNPDFVGRCAVFDSNSAERAGYDGDEFIFASYLIRARPRIDQVIPIFLREFMLGTEGRRELRSRCKTSAGQFNINTENLGAIAIPIPPFPLQQEFAHRVEDVEKLKATYKTSLAELDELFASLQYRAFRGELGTVPKTNEQSFEGAKI
jgi:type I restriction enzyme S subunit